ncbi:MAG: DUF1992 domain-containing protein [Anaerolineales bacterium]|nr:DUF1992 domain-containing protein [Anaerolineales bacterium]NUQ84801.1 DUF1992 domain-containing protein [Anaerolineales bacterium]
MSFEKTVEELIRQAQERGEFDNLPGRGKPIDLTAYFDTPEEVRVAQSVLKNAGFASREVELLKEIAELKQVMAGIMEEKKKQDIRRQIEQKQIELSLMMERQRRQRRQK